MAVFRVEKNRNYTVMSNYHLRDRNLSLRSIALLSIMLSLPEDWDYSLRGLAAICKDGRDAIATALKELEKCGYLKRSQTRDSHGRLSDIEYTVYEYPVEDSPCPENPYTVNPDTVNPNTDRPDTVSPNTVSPYTDNPPQINKDNINNKDKQITEKKSREKQNKKSIPLSVGTTVKTSDGWTDGSYDFRNKLKEVLEDNIALPVIIKRNGTLTSKLEEGSIAPEDYEAEYVDLNAVDYMLDIMTDCISGDMSVPVRIGGEDIPRPAVKDRLMKIDKARFLAVLRMISVRGGQIRNKKSYIISALYNQEPPSFS